MRLAGGAGHLGRTWGQGWGAWLFSIALAVTVWGCAVAASRVTPDSPPEVKERVVAERSRAYWKALTAGDFEAAHAFLSAGSRQAVTLVRFKALYQATKIVYRDVKIEKVTCGAAACKVALTIAYDHQLMNGVVTASEETWIIDDGQAWLIRN